MSLSNKNRPLLSILIPTRNRAEYLKYAIRSALNVPCDNMEIIVSENHSQDYSWDVCLSYSDPRLHVYRPEKPLPMHENFEFLLKKSCGTWVTFIGDDDAVMPHCCEHLSYLTNTYPQSEAIVSPRAYYFWDGCQQQYRDVAVSFTFKTGEKWQDSKKQLERALRCEIDYIFLPQMYSGGFHRRSLINRVLRSQNGLYFKSVSPDAYSALMACVHTYRYLEIALPLTWVGSSPHTAISSEKGQAKDRKADFFDFLDEQSLTLHEALGKLEEGTFSLYFFEAYISAFPVTSFSLLSQEQVEYVFLDAVRKFRMRGKEDAAIRLAKELGFELPDQHTSFKDIFYSFLKRLKRFSLPRKSTIRDLSSQPIYQYRSGSHDEHPDILSCDQLLSEAYDKFRSFQSFQASYPHGES